MASLTKNLHPPSKNFFRVQTRRLAVSFDASTRSVTRTGVEIFPHKATCIYVFFFGKSPKAAGRQRVKCTTIAAKTKGTMVRAKP